MTRPVRFLVIAILLSSCSESTSAPTAPRTALVETTTGPVQGQDDGNLYTYFGIPYAAPPVGPLRWKPPQPVTPWTEALETLAPEEPVIPGAPAIIAVNKCPQTLFGGDVSAQFVGPVDEDCLYLNVVTPKAGARLPVMVWIHGGGNVLGEGLQTDGGTSGTKLADTENVVVVSMNYRFGPFGFLAHDSVERRKRARRVGQLWLDGPSGRASMGARQHRGLRRRSRQHHHLRRISRWPQYLCSGDVAASEGAFSSGDHAKRHLLPAVADAAIRARPR